MGMRICPTCHQNYDDNDDIWKRKCYECWKHYKYDARIQRLAYKEDVYISHPSVTKEEMQEWTDREVAAGRAHRGWGVQEYQSEKFKIWVDSTDFD